MFKYTKASIELIIDNLKKYYRIFKYGSLIFTTAYFIFALATQIGNFIANIVLASLFVIYTIFELVTLKSDIKKIKRKIKRSYKWIKIIIRAFTLGATIYGIYTATTNVSPISIILATLMIILFVLQVILEIVVEVVENKIDLVMAAWKQDLEDMKKPVTVVSDVLKKISGKEVPEPKEKSKEIIFLEKKIKEKNKNKKTRK